MTRPTSYPGLPLHRPARPAHDTLMGIEAVYLTDLSKPAGFISRCIVPGCGTVVRQGPTIASVQHGPACAIHAPVALIHEPALVAEWNRRYWSTLAREKGWKVDVVDPHGTPLALLRDVYPPGTTVYRAVLRGNGRASFRSETVTL